MEGVSEGAQEAGFTMPREVNRRRGGLCTTNVSDSPERHTQGQGAIERIDHRVVADVA